MSQLATECGISKANIYHYYNSKEDLLFDILDVYLSALYDRLAALPTDGLTAEQRLRALISEILLAYEGMDAEHKIQNEGLPLLPPPKQETLKAYQRDMVQLMSAVLAELSPDCLARDPRKLRATTMSVFGMLNWYYMWNAKADSAARQDYASHVADLVLGGVRGL